MPHDEPLGFPLGVSLPQSRRELLGALPQGLLGLSMLGVPMTGATAAAVRMTQAQWLRLLGQARYRILREAGTEPPFSSPLNHEHRRGLFACAGCNLPLFSSSTKFDSGTGWPSFYRALPHAVTTRADHSFGMERTEVLCARCEGHLGHVFPDGPEPTGLRYCMNGLALAFLPSRTAS